MTNEGHRGIGEAQDKYRDSDPFGVRMTPLK
jgi:hypothetical protein